MAPVIPNHTRIARASGQILVALLAAMAAPSEASAQAPPASASRVTLTPVPDSVVDISQTESRDERWYLRSTGVPLNATVIASYPSGAKRLRVAVVDGRSEGVWMEWFPTGIPRYIASWRAGKGDGTWMYFHESGAIRERATVVADVYHGDVEGWHQNGVKQFDGAYVNNARSGVWRFWSSDGRLVRTESYPTPFAQLDTTSTSATLFFDQRVARSDINQWEFAFSRDGRTLYYATGSDSTPRQIMMQRWDGAQWSAPDRAPFSTPGRDGGSFVSPDGEWFYFSRSDSGPAGRRDLYRLPTGADGATPQRLTRTPRVGEVNISLDMRGRGYLWSDRTPKGQNSVGLQHAQVTARGLRVEAHRVDIPQHGRTGPNSPFIDPQGRFMIFANFGVTPGSQEDLYISELTNGVPGTPVPLGPLVNTTANETAPYLTPDGRFLLFSSDRESDGVSAGHWRIWVIPTARLTAPQR